ncbi:MAG: hypothetical protein HQM06_06035 [Magnetococcales bacterium]|nr:hypothetical protein [Magnetococcales bacterium]
MEKLDDIRYWFRAVASQVYRDGKCTHTVNPTLQLPDYNFVHNSIKSGLQRTDTPTIFTAFYGEIERSFELLCASPVRIKLFKIGYQFPDMETLDAGQNDQVVYYKNNRKNYFIDIAKGKSEVFANINDDLVLTLVEALSWLAKLTPSGTTARHFEKVVFLTGEIGEGKTIFVNYLISVHMNTFHEFKALPIKIDLTSPVEIDQKFEIELRIINKAIRIICENYIPKIVTVNDIVCALRNSKLDNEKKILVKKFFSKCKYNSDQESIQDYVELTKRDLRSAFIAVRSAFKRKGYGFLLFIDGLDNYDRDLFSEEVFARRNKEIFKFAKIANSLEDAYVIVSRYESYEYIKATSEASSPTHKIRNLTLLPVKTCEIIKSKFDLAGHLIDDFSKVVNKKREFEIPYDEDSKNVAKSLRVYLEKFNKFIIRMINYAFEYENEDKSILNDLLNKNNRLMLQSFNRVTKDVLNRIEILSMKGSAYSAEELSMHPKNYLLGLLSNESQCKNFIRKYRYIVINSLMINQLHLCFPKYKVVQSKDKMFAFKAINNASEKKFGVTKTSNYESCSIIPNVFYISSRSIYNEKKDPALCQIRILQYLNRKNFNCYNEDDVVCSLDKWFGYGEIIIKNELQMLYSNECVAKHPNNFWSITNMGAFLVNQLIFDFNYIYNAIDCIDISFEYYKSCMGPACSITQIDNRYKNDLTNYLKNFGVLLARKIIYSVAFAVYIDFIDSKECENYRNVNPPVVGLENISIGTRLTDSVISKIEKIFKNKESKLIENVALVVSEYIIKFLSHKNNPVIDDVIKEFSWAKK